MKISLSIRKASDPSNPMFAKDNTFSLYNNYPTKGELVGKIIIHEGKSDALYCQ